MRYKFNNIPVYHPSDFIGDSFRDGNYWYKVFRDEDSYKREKDILRKTSFCAGVVKMIEYGLLERSNDDGTGETLYAIKEEYVDGDSFRDYACSHHSEESGLRFFSALAATLYNLERNNLIHNDIKPENVLVREDGRPYVIDVNISKRIDEPVLEIHTHVSPGFAAPEKNRNEITVKSDIFSFGRMIKFFMDKNPELGAAAYSKEFHQIRTKCSMDDPTKRYGSFKEVLESLSEVLRNLEDKRKLTKNKKRKAPRIAGVCHSLRTFFTIILLIASAFFLFLGTYMIFRPADKEPRRIHASNPDLKEDCSIVINDIRNFCNKQ